MITDVDLDHTPEITFHTKNGKEVVFVKRKLPSAHPEIIHCRDCKHHWTFRPYGDFPTETCELEQTFYDANVDFCSLAERRTDEGSD